MAGIAAAHFLAHERVSSAPERRDVRRRLDGPHGGREQLQEHRYAAAGDARGLGHAEAFLEPDGRHRGVPGVVHGDVRAGRHDDRGRREGVEPAGERAERVAQRGREVGLGGLGERMQAEQARPEPRFEIAREGFVRPVREALVRRGAPREGDAFAEARGGVGPSEPGNPRGADPRAERGEHGLGVGVGKRRFADRHGAEGGARHGVHAFGPGVPFEDPGGFETVRKEAFHVLSAERGREADRAVGVRAVDLRDDDPLAARESVAGREAGAAVRDAVGVGEGEEFTGRDGALRRAARRRGGAGAAAGSRSRDRTREFADAGAERRRHGAAALLEVSHEVFGVGRRPRRRREVFGKRGGEEAGFRKRRVPERPRSEDHAREARVDPEGGHFAAERRHGTVAPEGAERGERFARGAPGIGGREGRPRQAAGLRHAPVGAGEGDLADRRGG